MAEPRGVTLGPGYGLYWHQALVCRSDSLPATENIRLATVRLIINGPDKAWV